MSDVHRRVETADDGTFDLGVPHFPPQALEISPPAGWLRRRLPYPEPGTGWLEIPLERTIGVCYRVVWADGASDTTPPPRSLRQHDGQCYYLLAITPCPGQGSRSRAG